MRQVHKYNWQWYRKNLIQCIRNTEPNCRNLLDLIGDCDSVVRGLTDRNMGIDSNRPQDYVVPVLVVRSYRLAISAIWMALAGFPDSVPNLTRTIFEISIRLLDMSDDPVAASLGYLIQGADEEISTAQAELAFRRDNNIMLGNLEKNLRRMERYLNELRDIAIKRGYNPKEIQKRHGRLNIRNICRRFGIEKAYLVDFAFYSSYVHEKHVAYSDHSFDNSDRRFFNLGIVSEGIPHAVTDVLVSLLRVLKFGCRLIEDEPLIEKVQALTKLANAVVKSGDF